MTSLFEDDPSAAFNAALLRGLTDDYAEMLILNPPTPAFNTRSNPRAEAFARAIAPKDITRLVAVLDKKNLTLIDKDELERLRDLAWRYEEASH